MTKRKALLPTATEITSTLGGQTATIATPPRIAADQSTPEARGLAQSIDALLRKRVKAGDLQALRDKGSKGAHSALDRFLLDLHADDDRVRQAAQALAIKCVMAPMPVGADAAISAARQCGVLIAPMFVSSGDWAVAVAQVEAAEAIEAGSDVRPRSAAPKELTDHDV